MTTECITAAIGLDCGPAEYEWAYLDVDMLNPDGTILWISLCEGCCIFWRAQPNPKRYRVRSLVHG